MVDSYRHVHPYGTDTTHRNHIVNKNTRLDRIYTPATHHIIITQHLEETLAYTDHKGILTHINIDNTSIKTSTRSPYWIFNNTLLQDTEYVKYMTEHFLTYTNSTPTTNITQYWEILKNSIKSRTQVLAKIINEQRKEKEKILQTEINLAQQINKDSPHIHALETQLEQIPRRCIKNKTNYPRLHGHNLIY